MISADAAADAEKKAIAAAARGDSLWQRKYVYPFCLAVVILACNQTTGINSVLNYAVDIFKESGMSGVFANVSDLAIKLVNVLMTIVACALVDKKGRKFLLKLGTAGIILGLCGVGTVFLAIKSGMVVASMATGVVATLFFFMFIAFYAVGPGVCVWLALSELMPTRIRATGMSIAMIINQGVSATIATSSQWSVSGASRRFYASRLHRDLLRHGGVLPAANQGQDARGDREVLSRRISDVPVHRHGDEASGSSRRSAVRARCAVRDPLTGATLRPYVTAADGTHS